MPDSVTILLCIGRYLSLCPTVKVGTCPNQKHGKTLQRPSLVLVKPRKDMDNVSYRRDITEILLKEAYLFKPEAFENNTLSVA